MRNLYFYGAVGALCLSLPIGAVAEGIPNIVITPTRFAQPLDQVIVPTQVITREEIQASGAHTVAGVLRGYAGIDVTQLGGAGQQTSVFLQGTNSNMVKVLINGVPINEATSGAAPWSTLALRDVERIDVVKGPLSTLWGSGAIGGVINIITRQATGNGGSLQIGGGNHGTRDGRISLHGVSGHSSGGISISGEHTDGEPVVQGFSPRAGFDNRNLSAYGNTRLGRLAVRADLWQNRGRQEYVTGGPPYSPYRLDSQDYLTQIASLKMRLPLARHWSVSSGLQQTRNRLQQNQVDPYASPPANDYADSLRNALEAQLDYVGEGAHVIVGTSQAHTHAQSLSYGTRYDGYRQTQAGFVEWRQQWQGVAFTSAGRRTVDSQFGGYNTWNLGVSLPLPRDLRLKLSTGTGYHAPTFNDLYGFGGNPALQPETSRSQEVQLIAPLEAYGELTVSAYRHRLRNLIETVLVDPSTYTYQNVNIGNARVRGLDVGWSWRPGPWSIGLEGGWMDPRNLDTGKPLLRRAYHHYRVRLGWRRGAWRVAGSWLYEGRRAGIGGQTLEPYRLLNLSLGYRITRHWSTALRVSNALNTAYTPAYYGKNVAYLGAGRSVRASLRYAFGAV